jgi:hypothetical protein
MPTPLLAAACPVPRAATASKERLRETALVFVPLARIPTAVPHLLRRASRAGALHAARSTSRVTSAASCNTA